LENIKLLNIKINKILWLYYYLSDNKVEEFDKDAEEEYVKRKKKPKKPVDDSDNDESGEESEGKSENESNNEINFKKISNCFDYYFKLIFKYIIEDI
jgi:hypothetical protein